MSEIAISADGVQIHYDVHGHGTPALVFVHGWCCNRRHWHKQVAHFADEYTVVAIDLAGHGESGLNRDRWTMPAFGRDVTAVVEQLDLPEVVLIGHSMGGTVNVEATQQMPARVIGFVGVETFKDLGQTRTQTEIAAIGHALQTDFVQTAGRVVRTSMFGPGADPAWVEAMAKELTAASPRVATDAVVHLFGYDAELRVGLQAIHAPKVLINSDYKPTDKEMAERLGMTVEFVPSTGHFIMLEVPDAFNRILGNAVQRIVAQSAV